MKKHPTSNSQHPTSSVLLFWALMAMAVVDWGSQKSFAQSTNAPSRLSYDAFRMISDRNIFNPSRYVRRSGAPRTASQPAARVESFSLVGVMAYEKGWFAFFDGTKGDYKQALQQDGAVGDYVVTRIAPDAVTLVAGTNTFELKVGMQMRREDEGDWFLSEGGETPRRRVISTRTRTRGSRNGESSTNGAADEMISGGEPEIIVLESGTPTETTEGETPAPNGNGNNNGEAARVEPEADNGGVTDPVLLRLMQRRQQMNQ